ncbi:unnamed protein product [Victoria cruziana]
MARAQQASEAEICRRALWPQESKRETPNVGNEAAEGKSGRRRWEKEPLCGEYLCELYGHRNPEERHRMSGMKQQKANWEGENGKRSCYAENISASSVATGIHKRDTECQE